MAFNSHGLVDGQILIKKETSMAEVPKSIRTLQLLKYTCGRWRVNAYAASLFRRLDWLVDDIQGSPQPDRTMARDRVLALYALAPARERTSAYLERFAADANGWRPLAVE